MLHPIPVFLLLVAVLAAAGFALPLCLVGALSITCIGLGLAHGGRFEDLDDWEVSERERAARAALSVSFSRIARRRGWPWGPR